MIGDLTRESPGRKQKEAGKGKELRKLNIKTNERSGICICGEAATLNTQQALKHPIKDQPFFC